MWVFDGSSGCMALGGYQEAVNAFLIGLCLMVQVYRPLVRIVRDSKLKFRGSRRFSEFAEFVDWVIGTGILGDQYCFCTPTIRCWMYFRKWRELPVDDRGEI